MIKDTDIERAAAELRNNKLPSDWNAVFEDIKKKYPGSDIKDFHKIHEASGLGIHNRIWEHNATAADVRKSIKRMPCTSSEDFPRSGNFSTCYHLFKQGKWTVGKDKLTIDDFQRHTNFKLDPKPDPEKVAKGVKTLLLDADYILTRGHAFNILTHCGKIKMPMYEYHEIVKTFSKISGNKLGTEASDKQWAKKEAALKTVHNWSAAQTITHLKSIVGKKPDILLWTAFDLRKKGKDIGKIPGSLFDKVFLKQPSIKIAQAKGMDMISM